MKLFNREFLHCLKIKKNWMGGRIKKYLKLYYLFYHYFKTRSLMHLLYVYCIFNNELSSALFFVEFYKIESSTKNIKKNYMCIICSTFLEWSHYLCIRKISFKKLLRIVFCITLNSLQRKSKLLSMNVLLK